MTAVFDVGALQKFIEILLIVPLRSILSVPLNTINPKRLASIELLVSIEPIELSRQNKKFYFFNFQKNF